MQPDSLCRRSLGRHVTEHEKPTVKWSCYFSAQSCQRTKTEKFDGKTFYFISGNVFSLDEMNELNVF